MRGEIELPAQSGGLDREMAARKIQASAICKSRKGVSTPVIGRKGVTLSPVGPASADLIEIVLRRRRFSFAWDHGKVASARWI